MFSFHFNRFRPSFWLAIAFVNNRSFNELFSSVCLPSVTTILTSQWLNFVVSGQCQQPTASLNLMCVYDHWLDHWSNVRATNNMVTMALWPSNRKLLFFNCAIIFWIFTSILAQDHFNSKHNGLHHTWKSLTTPHLSLYSAPPGDDGLEIENEIESNIHHDHRNSTATKSEGRSKH